MTITFSMKNVYFICWQFNSLRHKQIYKSQCERCLDTERKDLDFPHKERERERERETITIVKYCQIFQYSRYCSGPDTACAALIIDGARATFPNVGDATCTLVEAVLVIWVRVDAVRFAITETRSRGMCGGGSCWSGCASAGFWCSGGGQGGQL